MSTNRLDNNIFIRPYEQYELKTYTQNNADNPLLTFGSNVDTFQKTALDNQEEQIVDTTSLRQDLEKTKSEQGILGKLWDGFKNLTGIGAGSSKAQQAIEDYENGLITAEEMQKAVDGYKEGQKMAVDVVADIASGMLSIVVFGAATALMGPVGALLVAGATGAISKVGIKAGDAALGGREYSGKDLLYDGVTGGINGLLGPITNGIGNTVTKTIATKFGITALKEGAEEVAQQGIKQGFKQFAKNVVLNQSDDIIGGTLKQRAVALGAGMATDGALGGASDNMVRAAFEGENILKAGAEGFVGGLVMAPIVGGGMKLAGKGAKALNNKITTSRVLPDGLNTNFKQGATGDCALLSTIDGIMANPNTANKIKNSITRTAFGDYDVKIGDRIIRVSKDALSDEILSDTTGIKLFEAAYKQMGGSIDGEFAEVVAKQFGLNPVHIVSEGITDELLEKLSKDSDNLVLSLGMDGHYYSIQGIDPQTKMITLVDPYDTSKTLRMSFDEVKAKGASIDGGSVAETDLPNVERSADEFGFRGAARIDKKGLSRLVGENKELGEKCQELLKLKLVLGNVEKLPNSDISEVLSKSAEIFSKFDNDANNDIAKNILQLAYKIENPRELTGFIDTIYTWIVKEEKSLDEFSAFINKAFKDMNKPEKHISSNSDAIFLMSQGYNLDTMNAFFDESYDIQYATKKMRHILGYDGFGEKISTSIGDITPLAGCHVKEFYDELDKLLLDTLGDIDITHLVKKYGGQISAEDKVWASISNTPAGKITTIAQGSKTVSFVTNVNDSTEKLYYLNGRMVPPLQAAKTIVSSKDLKTVLQAYFLGELNGLDGASFSYTDSIIIEYNGVKYYAPVKDSKLCSLYPISNEYYNHYERGILKNLPIFNIQN